MGSIQSHQPLVVRDDNVEITETPNVAHEALKAKRNRWNEAQQIALVNQMYMDECCPIGKGSHGAINAAWSNLLDGLRRHPDGLFDDFNLCQRTVQRQLAALMEKQDKRNAEAQAATGRGGCAVHTDLEQGVQRLLDLPDGLKQQRAIAKEQRNTKLARLDEDAKQALRKSMETHGKRARRASSDRQSHGSGGGRSSIAQLEASMRDTNNLLMLAMEEHVETQAEMAWMKTDKFYKLQPHVAPDPGPKEAWIAKAVAAHHAKLHCSSVEDNPTSEEDDLNNVDIANVCDV
eukprot:scaffold336_cov372-Pavlova_lutheri.AAC.3